MLKLNAVGLFVTDMARSVAFYRDVFEMVTPWNGEANAELSSDGLSLILFGRDDFETMTNRRYTYPQRLNGTMEISFDCPNFAAVEQEYARVVAAGAQPIFPPTTEPWGQRTCYVADPDGNLIEISSFQR